MKTALFFLQIFPCFQTVVTPAFVFWMLGSS